MTEAVHPTTVDGLTILVVDDSAMMRMLIKRVTALTDVPIACVLEAANGLEALAVLEAHRVDALFTDINMPVMSGTDLLNEIERRGAWPRLLRAVISTDGSAARRAEAGALGVEFYLEKPFRPEVMRDVLCQIHSRACAL